MSPELKAMLAALAAYLAANKSEGLSLVDAFAEKEEGYISADISNAIGKISNPFVKAAAEWVWSSYGNDLPGLLKGYEGDAYDKLVAFLKDESK
jgi:hypothetical protein